MGQGRKKTYIAAVALILLGLLAFHLFAQGIFSEYVDELEAFALRRPFLGAALFLFLAAFSVLLGPFSSSPLVPVAVSVWGVTTTFSILLAGWLAGDLFVYLIGRYVGHGLVGRIVGHKKLAGWIQFLEENLTFALLLLFRLAAPSETGYAFGIFRYRFSKYVLISFLAELPFALLTVFASQALLDSGWVFFAILAALWLALVAASAATLRHKARTRARARYPEENIAELHDDKNF